MYEMRRYAYDAGKLTKFRRNPEVKLDPSPYGFHKLYLVVSMLPEAEQLIYGTVKLTGWGAEYFWTPSATCDVSSCTYCDTVCV